MTFFKRSRMTSRLITFVLTMVMISPATVSIAVAETCASPGNYALAGNPGNTSSLPIFDLALPSHNHSYTPSGTTTPPPPVTAGSWPAYACDPNGTETRMPVLTRIGTWPVYAWEASDTATRMPVLTRTGTWP